jgi:uncharacterized protein YgbK (DUF1537 family)
LAAWLADPGAPGWAVADASNDDDVAAIGAAWAAATGVLLAGSSAILAAAVVHGCVPGADGPGPASAGRDGVGGAPFRTEMTAAGSIDSAAHRVGVVTAGPVASGCCAGDGPCVALPVPALVVVGSLHPVARAQLAALASAVPPGVEVIATASVDGPVDAAAADAAARSLADTVADRLAAGEVATVVIVGGDTAAAVLGAGTCIAGGTVTPGIPWARRAGGGGPLVVTKAGGFGAASTLIDLFAGRPVEGRWR